MSEPLEFASRKGIRAIEDCAQAHGAAIGDKNVGSFGDTTAFSFIRQRTWELQAAVLRTKLTHLEYDNMRRRTIAQAYTAAISRPAIIPPAEIVGTTHAMHLDVIECDGRAYVKAAFREAHIEPVGLPRKSALQRGTAGDGTALPPDGYSTDIPGNDRQRCGRGL